MGYIAEAEVPEWVDNPDHVSDFDIHRYNNLKPVAGLLNKLYGEGKWGDSEVKDYIIQKRKERLRGMQDKRNLERAKEEDHNAQLDAIIEEYRQHFKRVSPNDLVNLRELARIQLMFNQLARREYMLQRDPKDNAKDLETISKIRKEQTKAFNDIEKALGIDREARTEESDMVDLFEQIKRRAVDLIKKRSHTITCTNCEREGVTINYGFVVFHLDQNDIAYNLKFVCPRCKQVSTQFPEAEWKN